MAEWKWDCEMSEGWERLERRGLFGKKGGFLFSFCCFRSSKVLYLFHFFFCLGVWGRSLLFFLSFLIQCKYDSFFWY